MNSNKKFIDLHIHTNLSDGTFSPDEVISYAIENNLSAIAITDHDCVLAVPLCLEISNNKNIEVIPGIELTAEINDIEIHILGLFIDWNASWFLEKLKEIQKIRYERMKKMILKLNDFGINILEEEVFSLSNRKGSVSRLHLARALSRKGIINFEKEAFDRYIGENKPCYVKRFKISSKEAIRMIKELRGISILAHPGTTAHDELIPELASYGLMGLEVYHSKHNDKLVHYYTKLAQKHNLLLSGGSDCHGAGDKGYPLMGKIKVPYTILEGLKAIKYFKE